MPPTGTGARRADRRWCASNSSAAMNSSATGSISLCRHAQLGCRAPNPLRARRAKLLLGIHFRVFPAAAAGRNLGSSDAEQRFPATRPPIPSRGQHGGNMTHRDRPRSPALREGEQADPAWVFQTDRDRPRRRGVTQNPVPFGECGFDPHLRHQEQSQKRRPPRVSPRQGGNKRGNTPMMRVAEPSPGHRLAREPRIKPLAN